MNHEEIRAALGEWLDGELDAAAYAAVSAHLDACPSCRSETLRLRRLGAAVFAPPAADPRSNEAFVARVMARVEADGVTPWERLAARFLVPALGLALAGLLFTISVPRADADAPLGVAMPVDADSELWTAP